MNSLICIIFTSVLLSQVTCNTLAKMKLHKEAEVRSLNIVCTKFVAS